jgi:isoleucyl-tRNA synthetase
MDNGIIKKGGDLPLPLDANGRFNSQVPEWKGILVFDANKSIMQNIKQRGRMVRQLQMFHSYPFCWRSETPLIYRAVPCWFIRVEVIKEQLLACQNLTHWVPSRISNRFVKWLEGSVDWAVSRNRFWGTPLPLWANEDFSEVICIGSIDELEKLSGVRISDLHRENVDQIQIPSQNGNGVLRRVEEVFDCWFESGSMPYAQVHYPFENQELFQKSFPADFIAEGIDQTRGWFYTLMVLSTALYNKPAFKNVIVNGLVLAADGKKMSKRLKNYPDPVTMIDSYGADALRLYLINSPVVHGDDLRFREEGVSDVLKDVLLPWFHAYRFFVEACLLLSTPFKPTFEKCLQSDNIMDRWILSAAQFLVKFVHTEMESYCLYTVIPALVKFVEQLTNWYLRSNRSRMQGDNGLDDQITSLNVMFEILLTMSVLMAPFTPYLAEYFYQNLRKVLPPETADISKDDYHINVDSIHYLPIPKPREEIIDTSVLRSIELLQQAIELARSLRERHTLPLKQPLQQVRVILQKEEELEKLHKVKQYLQDQIKVKEVLLSSDVSSVRAKLIPNQKQLGMKLRSDRGKVVKALELFGDDEIAKFVQSGKLEVEGHILTSEDVSVQYSFAVIC